MTIAVDLGRKATKQTNVYRAVFWRSGLGKNCDNRSKSSAAEFCCGKILETWSEVKVTLTQGRYTSLHHASVQRDWDISLK